MTNRHPFLKGTLILICAGFLSRVIGFFYRVFLSHTIGAEGLGLYQLIFPIQTLCMALTTSGIQTSISRFAAARNALKDHSGANELFFGGAGLSLVLSGLAAFLLYYKADDISRIFLFDIRCTPLLQIVAFTLPLGTMHSCISSYYYARKETQVPSGIQLLEQIVRVGFSWLAYQVFLAEGRPVTPLIAVIGAAASELVAAFVSLLLFSQKLQKQNYHLRSLTAPFSYLGQIVKMAVPLTANRVLLTFLTSIETTQIPIRLQMSGLSSQNALSVYGVLTGMTLPLIFFPSTITNSVSIMLLPSVAELQALGNKEKIYKNTSAILKCCSLLGIFCTAAFFLFSGFLGTILFHNELASKFLRSLAFLCPFLYINTTIASTLHGLGKTGICFIHNIISVSIRLIFVLFVIPSFGIQGYLWGILLGELVLSVLNGSALFRYLHLK